MEKIITDFQQRKLQIDFIELALIQNKDNNPVSYKGPGYIRQTDDGLLTLTLYSVDTANTDVVASFNNFARVKSGALYDDADYYTLTGTATDGHRWIRALQTFIVDQVTASPQHKEFAPRIQGLVSGFTQIRAIDRIIELAESGSTNPSFVEAWKICETAASIRPSAAAASFRRQIISD